MKPLKPEEVRTFQKHNICLYFMNRWTSLLKQEKYKKLRKFYYKKFERKLNLYRTQEKPSFDFLDKFRNTPLHIAAQYGRPSCVKTLLDDYRLSLNLRNKQGWMAKDLLHDTQVRKVFAEFYSKLEREIQLAIT